MEEVRRERSIVRTLDSGSWLSMEGLRYVFVSQHIVGTKFSANAAIDANKRFLALLIPEHGSEWTSFLTLATSNAQLFVEGHAAAASRR